MLSPNLLLLALTAVTTTALPQSTSLSRSDPVTHLRAPLPGAQSCHAKEQIFDLLYLIDVGAPYAAGNGCMDIFHAISKMLHDQGIVRAIWDDSTGIYRWRCDQGSDEANLDFTRLEVGVIDGLTASKVHDGLGDWMNDVLEEMYPGIGFNCPNS